MKTLIMIDQNGLWFAAADSIDYFTYEEMSRNLTPPLEQVKWSTRAAFFVSIF